MEDINDEPFEFDGSPYSVVPEYTNEELLALENERAEREAQRVEQAEVASGPRTSATWWCSCGCCVLMDREEESLCCEGWDIIQPSVSPEESSNGVCTSM